MRQAHPNSRFKTIGESILFGAVAVASTSDHTNQSQNRITKLESGKKMSKPVITNRLKFNGFLVESNPKARSLSQTSTRLYAPDMKRHQERHKRFEELGQ